MDFVTAFNAFEPALAPQAPDVTDCHGSETKVSLQKSAGTGTAALGAATALDNSSSSKGGRISALFSAAAQSIDLDGLHRYISAVYQPATRVLGKGKARTGRVVFKHKHTHAPVAVSADTASAETASVASTTEACESSYGEDRAVSTVPHAYTSTHAPMSRSLAFFKHARQKFSRRASAPNASEAANYKIDSYDIDPKSQSSDIRYAMSVYHWNDDNTSMVLDDDVALATTIEAMSIPYSEPFAKDEAASSFGAHFTAKAADADADAAVTEAKLGSNADLEVVAVEPRQRSAINTLPVTASARTGTCDDALRAILLCPFTEGESEEISSSSSACDDAADAVFTAKAAAVTAPATVAAAPNHRRLSRRGVEQDDAAFDANAEYQVYARTRLARISVVTAKAIAEASTALSSMFGFGGFTGSDDADLYAKLLHQTQKDDASNAASDSHALEHQQACTTSNTTESVEQASPALSAPPAAITLHAAPDSQAAQAAQALLAPLPAPQVPSSKPFTELPIEAVALAMSVPLPLLPQASASSASINAKLVASRNNAFAANDEQLTPKDLWQLYSHAAGAASSIAAARAQNVETNVMTHGQAISAPAAPIVAALQSEAPPENHEVVPQLSPTTKISLKRSKESANDAASVAVSAVLMSALAGKNHLNSESMSSRLEAQAQAKALAQAQAQAQQAQTKHGASATSSSAASATAATASGSEEGPNRRGLERRVSSYLYHDEPLLEQLKHVEHNQRIATILAYGIFRQWLQRRRAQLLRPEGIQVETSESVFYHTAMLLIQNMVFAMRADGSIDSSEHQALIEFCSAVFNNQIKNIRGEIDRMLTIDLDPELLVKQVRFPEESIDMYLIAAVMLDGNHILEQGYLEGLAACLGIDPSLRRNLDQRAHELILNEQVSLGG